MHDTDELRAARLGWNALIRVHDEEFMMNPHGFRVKWIDSILDEMNKNGLFSKPGDVKQGPIPGDVD